MPLGSLANRPLLMGMWGLCVANAISGAPVVQEYYVASSSPQIRPGDPVVLLNTGKIRRATPSDAVLLGFAASPSSFTGFMGGQFPFPPVLTSNRIMANDGSADPAILVFVVDGTNTFSCKTLGTSSAARRGTTWDLAYLATSPTPTVASQGTTGSTTYTYKVVPRTLIGPAVAGTAGAATDGNATLSGTNFQRITWSAVATAVEYEIWKLNGSTYELLVVVDAGTLTYDDTGAVTTSTARAIPSTNESGYALTFGASDVDIFQAIDAIIEEPTDTVATSGMRWRFDVPTAKRQYNGGGAPLSS